MLSFHGKKKIKNKYLARVRAHKLADELVQGTGWKNGKGCAVGCTLEAYDHDRYPDELGLPVWIAYLKDRIFEGLNPAQAQSWPEQFLDATPVGVDVERVKHQLAIRRMNRLLKLQKKNMKKVDDDKKIIQQVIDTIEQVKSCHDATLNNQTCDFDAATSAAWSAAWRAGWSAGDAAYRAAESAAWQQEADDLIELLKLCR